MRFKKEILFQLCLHALVLLFFAYDWYNQEFRPDRLWFFLMYALAGIFINYYLMPKWLYVKKYTFFFGGVLLILAALIFIEEAVLEQLLYPNTTRAATFPGVLFGLAGVLPIMTILSSGKFAWDSFQKQMQIDALQNLIQDSELQFLRSQINPHFLFNNLNNLYAYALEGNAKTPEIILELSGVLRYMLYECKEQFVSIAKELEQLNNFIKLYKLQIEDRGIVTFKVENIQPNYTIAPLILLVFIENAFKHSQAGQTSQILIDIKVSMLGNKLIFYCNNNYRPTNNGNTLANGIGLANVQKRLQLLYANKHHLIIDKNATNYNVQLELDLKQNGH